MNLKPGFSPGKAILATFPGFPQGISSRKLRNDQSGHFFSTFWDQKFSKFVGPWLSILFLLTTSLVAGQKQGFGDFFFIQIQNA